MHALLKLPALKPLEREIFNAIERGGEMNQVSLLRTLGDNMSPATLSRAVTKLVLLGLVEKTGSTKSASFSVSKSIGKFSKPAALRPTVSYDLNRILGYEPNKTRWLSEEAEQKMRAAADLAGPRLDASTYSRKIAERFLIDLSWASSALEGNTYEYLETEALIKYAETAVGKNASETAMILNHKRAISYLLEELSISFIEPQKMQRLHAFLMQSLLSYEDLGKIRTSEVRIGGSSYRPTSDQRQLIEGLGALCLNVSQTENPYEASFVLLAGMSYLQAFEDGNKRMGRLSCNVPLLANGLPPMSFTTIGKSDYTLGLIVFYESGDSSLLAEVVASAYVKTAPTYTSALADKRIPSGAELRLRDKVDGAVQTLVKQKLGSSTFDLNRSVEAMFEDLSDKDRAVARHMARSAMEAINQINAHIWGVSEEDATKLQNMTDDPAP